MISVIIPFSYLLPRYIIAAVIGAAVVALIFVLKGKNGGKKSLDEQKDSTKKFITIGIRDNAVDFAELLEPTYALACGKTNKKDVVFDRWNEIIADGEYTSDFKTAFASEFGNVAKWKGKKKKYVKNANALVKMIFNAGIIRSGDTETKADDTTAEKYDTTGNLSIETDQIYEVLAPYWYQDEQVLVKGVLR